MAIPGIEIIMKLLGADDITESLEREERLEWRLGLTHPGKGESYMRL